MFLVTDKEKQDTELSTLHTKISSSKNNVDEYTKEPEENDVPQYEADENRDNENVSEEYESNDIEKDQPPVRSVNESRLSPNLFSLFGSYST